MSRLRAPALGATLLASLLTAGWVAPTRLVADLAKPNSLHQGKTADDLYLLCSFYPKPGTCERVYQQAIKDKSISAQAVKAEYLGYARYLNGTGSLTEADRQYLRDNNILVPRELSPADQAGLHNVINDASLSAKSRPLAVNNFLSRAVEAEIYCGLNSCTDIVKGNAVAGV